MSAAIAAARARAAEIKKKLEAGKSNAGTSSPQPTPAGSTGVQDRIAQMKARVAAATSRSRELAEKKPGTSIPPPPQYQDDFGRARGGLDIGLHPALQESTASLKSKTLPGRPGKNVKQEAKKAQLDLTGPSFEELKQNPYFDVSISTKNATAKARTSRQLIMNQQGKYIQQAAALRRQAQLEEMKKRIAEKTRLANLEEDAEKAFLVPSPPDIEWWDEGLVEGPSYEVLDDKRNWKVDTPDSIITIYIQHPVLIEPPQEKIVPTAKPMYLTAKEQAKLRRQRRMADLKEKQAKIRLGLEPPPPPKVKKSNLMRVLGEQAIQDPTAVEARVNREITERKQTHEELNAERALTKEEKHEKLKRQQAEDEAKGIHVRVYRIDSLANGKHRYQIGINADQQKLTGVCIMHPKMNLVVVEGGEHSIRAYDKLMLNRIRWTEMEAPSSVREGNRERDEMLAKAGWLNAEDENGSLKSLDENKCECIFRGEEKKRAFFRWLGARAKDVLSRAKMDSFWGVAKGHAASEVV
ncbi:U4/U5/U6 small nuclear ribonucleoprotein prp3 [Elasticomyces elasticus]|nr:U4/U5/U6 small nuclear ribonucleoprotein prp3 [Elasticomyces elasticus]